MYKSEGTLRIRLLGKRIMIFGALAGIALWILVSVLRSGGGSASGSFEGQLGLGELFFLIAAPLGCGAMLWLIAWILEGFMTSSRHE